MVWRFECEITFSSSSILFLIRKRIRNRITHHHLWTPTIPFPYSPKSEENSKPARRWPKVTPTDVKSWINKQSHPFQSSNVSPWQVKLEIGNCLESKNSADIYTDTPTWRAQITFDKLSEVITAQSVTTTGSLLQADFTRADKAEGCAVCW